MSTADDLLAHMEEQIRREAAQPHADAADLGRASLAAMIRDTGGEPVQPAATLDVRMHGEGVQGHDVGIEEAFGILNPLQQAFSSMGQSVAQLATAAGRIPGVIKAATRLRISPAVLPGSVVFHLRGPAEVITGDELPGLAGIETLADVTMDHLMRVIRLASETDNAIDMAGAIRRFGPRSAKHLNELAGAIVDHGIDVTLTWRSERETRTALLDRRGALGLQGAISHNRTQVNTISLEGVLVTVSTVEPVAIKLDDQRLVHLTVDPELAQTLDHFCFKRVLVNAEETIEWRLSKGTEVRRYALLSIHLLH